MQVIPLMSRRFTLALFITALLVALIAASLESVPGYMDADYYYAGALRIVHGAGETEPYLWNYLNSTASLPAPAFAYWMPLTSLLAALGMKLAGTQSFWAARIGFILLAALIPPLTAWMALRLTRRAPLARLAGLMALFCGFYLAYQTTTDAFPLYMTLGSLFLITAAAAPAPVQRWPLPVRFFTLGMLVGLMHMTRADGLLWLAAAGLAALAELPGWKEQSAVRVLRAGFARLAAMAAAVVTGYGVVEFPWFFRNMQIWGSLMPPGNARAVWITEYPQTMIYPASLLTPQHWLSAGLETHLQAWLTALANHIQTAVAVQGTIVLFPFIVIGMWKLRGKRMVQLGAVMWLLNLLVMTFAFPYAGVNGGFFHSGAALQPLFWAAAPLGLESAAVWYAEKRRLSTSRKIRRFSSGLVVGTCLLLTGVLFVQRVVGSGEESWEWNADSLHYQSVERLLQEQGADQNASVMVNNPPGYWLVSGRPAVVIPAGDEQMLLAAARQFQTGYLVFEASNPEQLAGLYHGRVTPPELVYLTSVGDTRLYRFNWSGDQ